MPDHETQQVRAFARSGTLMFLMFVANAAAQLFLTVGVARYLLPVSAGVFFEAVALFMITWGWSMLGADSGLVRALPRIRIGGTAAELRATLRAAGPPPVLVSLAAAVAGYAAAPALAETFFDGPRQAAAVDDIRVVAVFLPVATAGGLALAASRGLGSSRQFAGQNSVFSVVRAAVVVGAAAAGIRGAGLALAWAAPLVPSCLVALLALRFFVRRALPHDGNDPLSRRAWAAFWAYALPRGLAAVLMTTVTWLDILLVGRYASTGEAAVYAVASRFSLVGTYALQAIGMAVAPQFSELLARRDRAATQSVYQAGTWWAMCLSWPFYLLVMVFPSTILSLVFGGRYTGAATALVILAAAGLVDLATGNAQALLLMSGRSGVFLANALVSFTANLALNLVLIPRYGVTGAGIAWATSIGLSNLAAAVQVRIFLGVRPLGAGFPIVASASFAAFALVPLLARAALGTTATALIAALAVGIPLFCAWVWRERNTLRLTDLRRGALAVHRASVTGSS